MMHWIVLTGLSLILGPINILIRALINLANVELIFSILGWVLSAYFFLVVWSLKNEIEDEDYQGKVYYGCCWKPSTKKSFCSI